MLFNSYVFVFAFFPIVLLSYFGLNHFKKYEAAKALLLLESLFFYGYYNPWYLIIIVSSIVVNFLFGRVVQKEIGVKLKKLLFILALMANIGVLFVFKYYDFFIENINAVFKTSIGFLNVALPLGISFFTFQQLSYVVDTYKGNAPKYSFINYALFVTYFPQLIAGPIVLHNEMVPQFEDESKKKFNSDNFAAGITQFAFGLGKKVILADTFGFLVDSVFGENGFEGIGTLNAAIVMLAYTFQIYFDFSGYSDMATGIGKMMNLDIVQNFNSPYKAISIVDFWKRWHMTLTRFFTTYIYIPLGGNRKGKARTYVNIMIVFLVSGIWHGANWTFIIWGVLHGVANVITRMIDKKTGLFSKDGSCIRKVILWALTFAFINLTWVIFRADSMEQAFAFYKELFSFNFSGIESAFREIFVIDGLELLGSVLSPIKSVIKSYSVYLFFAVAVILSVFCENAYNICKKFKPTVINALLTTAILFWCIMSFAGVSSFLYWNF